MNKARDAYVEDNFESILDAFEDSGWEAVVDNVSYKGYASLSNALHKSARMAANEDREAHAKVLRLLGEACSMMLSPDKSNEPFEPLGRIGSSRSIVPDDFTNSEIEFFAHIVDSIDRPILKGRLADLVWLLRHPRKVKFALEAIDSYMQVPLDVDNWFGDGEQCWKRAIGLCRMIGPTGADHLGRIEKSIIEALYSATTEDKFFSYGLATTLWSDGLGRANSAGIAAKLGSLAKGFDSIGNFYASGRFYNEAARWFRSSEDDEKAVDMTVAEAEAFVSEATARMSSNNPSHGVAASFVENAIQVYRTVPRNQRGHYDVDQRIQELRLRLSEHGKRAQEEMVTARGDEIDVGDTIQKARDTIRGKPVHEALKAFADLHRISVRELREAAIKNLSHTPFLASIPKDYFSHDGRVIARTPGIIGSMPSVDDEEEILGQMNRVEYPTRVGIIVQAMILPALDVLTMEHRVRTIDLINLARLSPIVPIGREVLFGRALAHGFNRDFATSIHLLAPQIEHMVRVSLKIAGVSTSHLDKDGIETENGLSALIDLPQTMARFGEDVTYEIKSLFCDQMGPNLRNNIAHGLLDDQQANSVEAVYAWWLGLQLVFNTYWYSLNKEKVGDQQQEVSEDDFSQG